MDVGFVWDEAKYRAVVEQHSVSFYEVVAAFDDPAGYEVEGDTTHEQRYLWVGKTPWDACFWWFIPSKTYRCIAS